MDNHFKEGFEKVAVGARIYSDMEDYLGRKSPKALKLFKAEQESANYTSNKKTWGAYSKKYNPHYQAMLKEKSCQHGKLKPKRWYNSLGISRGKYNTKDKVKWYRDSMPTFK